MKTLPFVLVCIVALAMVSSIGIALIQALVPRVEIETSPRVQKHVFNLTQPIHPMGDPIDDPKPNKH